MTHTTNIRSDRSRIQTRQKCERERFLGYHAKGTGMAKVGAKYDAEFGAMLHELLADVLVNDGIMSSVVWESVSKRLEVAVGAAFGKLYTEKTLQHICREQWALLMLFVHGWVKFRLPFIKKEYDILEVETERTVVFKATDYLPMNVAQYQRNLELPLRRDAVLAGKTDPQLMYILDWKTTSRTGSDWETGLQNSLQSNLYIAGSEELNSDAYWGGIIYEGLVKGRREVDKANSSPFKGMPIMYGSFLYGWKKDGVVSATYKTGAQRVFLPDAKEGGTWSEVLEYIGTIHPLNEFFPVCIAYRPNSHKAVVAQQILAENDYANKLELYNSIPPPEQWHYESLFEQTLDGCYKYGSKHPCPFVDVCHGGHQLEDGTLYEPRTDHHEDTSK